MNKELGYAVVIIFGFLMLVFAGRMARNVRGWNPRMLAVVYRVIGTLIVIVCALSLLVKR